MLKPAFLENEDTEKLLQEVVHSIPENTDLYLYGGAIRNTFFSESFNVELPQRDFDFILVGDREGFKKNLVDKGFELSEDPIHKMVKTSDKFTKAKIPQPQQYGDWIHLDVAVREERDIHTIL